MARPSDKTVELTDKIIARMTEGESLRSICRDDDFPHIATVLRWVASDDVFRDQYACAMDIRADMLFEQAIEIADTPVLGIERETSETGVKIKEGDMLGHRRLQVDTRKWAASKMNPKKYGDKQEITAVGDAVVVVRDFTGRKKESDE
jgi:hypothetical protein